MGWASAGFRWQSKVSQRRTRKLKGQIFKYFFLSQLFFFP